MRDREGRKKRLRKTETETEKVRERRETGRERNIWNSSDGERNHREYVCALGTTPEKVLFSLQKSHKRDDERR